MDRSDRLSLPYVIEAQAQKHVTVNETFRALDALMHLTVRSRTVNAQPGAPHQSEAYILPPGKTGADWAGFADHAVAAWQDNAWMEYAPVEGLTAFVVEEGRHLVWEGAAWTAFDSEEASRFGVNTGPDDINRLTVKSDAVLFSHDDVTPGTGNMLQVVNKASVTDNASLLFQTAFSGRVELGLTGSDDLTIRVSADGANFLDAIVIDHTTGEVSFPNTADLGNSGPVTPVWVPAGARFAISATEGSLWTMGQELTSNLLSPTGASFSSGTNRFILSQADEPLVASAGVPRRSYDSVNSTWGYASAADVPTFPNGAPVPPQLQGLTLSFDYVVDPLSGDDSNQGTPAAPFQSLTALRTALVSTPLGTTVNALVKRGEYIDQPFALGLADGTTNVVLVFEPGCTLRSTDTSAGGSTQAIDITLGQVTLYGNGLHVRDWNALEVMGTDDFQNSSNALAAHGSGILIAHDVKVSNCGDGITAHSDARVEAYRCWVEDCDKYAAVHVNNSTSYHEDCVLIGGNGHGGANVRIPAGIVGAFGGSSGDHEFVRCRFLPSPNGQTNRVDGTNTARFRECELGSYNDDIRLVNAHVTDSFVHFYGQVHEMTEPMTRCYGKASIRLRQAGNAAAVISDCVFVGPASGQLSRFLFTNYDPGSFGQITIQDCVITGYAEAFDIDRTEAPAYWQASGSLIESCTFFGNTSDFGTNGPAEVGTTITNSVFTDPSLGSFSGSQTMADYAVGAGTDGFSAGEAVTVGPPATADDVWQYTDLAAVGLADGDVVRFTSTDGTVTDLTVSGGMLSIPPGHWKLIHGPI